MKDDSNLSDIFIKKTKLRLTCLIKVKSAKLTAESTLGDRRKDYTKLSSGKLSHKCL